MPERMDDSEIRRRLERAIRTMPRVTRAVFLAHRLDAMSYGEIARSTGLSEREVERHLALAIVAIDRSLNDRPYGRWRRLLCR